MCFECVNEYMCVFKDYTLRGMLVLTATSDLLPTTIVFLPALIGRIIG